MCWISITLLSQTSIPILHRRSYFALVVGTKSVNRWQGDWELTRD